MVWPGRPIDGLLNAASPRYTVPVRAWNDTHVRYRHQSKSAPFMISLDGDVIHVSLMSPQPSTMERVDAGFSVGRR